MCTVHCLPAVCCRILYFPFLAGKILLQAPNYLGCWVLRTQLSSCVKVRRLFNGRQAHGEVRSGGINLRGDQPLSLKKGVLRIKVPIECHHGVPMLLDKRPILPPPLSSVSWPSALGQTVWNFAIQQPAPCSPAQQKVAN